MQGKMWWLETKEPLKAPSSVLSHFHGADPKKQWTDVPLKLDEVQVYAFWHVELITTQIRATRGSSQSLI